MQTASSELISFGRRLAMLAGNHPEKTAIIFAAGDGRQRSMTWRELDTGANRLARLLAAAGVGTGSMVAVGLKNSPEHFLVTYGAWRLGACVLPMRAELPDPERDRILQTAAATVAVGDWDGVKVKLLRKSDLVAAADLSAAPLPDRIARPGKAIGSGGSTGLPKIIVDLRLWANKPGGYVSGFGARLGMRTGQVQLLAGPLYHNSPFCWSHWGLFETHTLVVMEKFDAARALDLIEEHRINWGFLVPTMMHRLIRQPDIRKRDLSSVHAFWHTGAPCAPWLKQAWIDLLGPERLYEAYGSTENLGSASIRGDEWLLHPGSVGRPMGCDLRILNERAQPVATGDVGEIFMRPHSTDPTYRYIGAPPARSTPDGFQSVGDLGRLDADGYLYLADRRTDLIISGGANIFPAEVEAALTEHPAVADAAVIGVPDSEWGRRVHAVVQPVDPGAPLTAADLDSHCRERLAAYKLPKGYTFVAALPRDASGKIRRSALPEIAQ